MREFTGDEQKPSKAVAFLVKLGTRVGVAGCFWYGVYFLSSLFGMAACTAPRPQPENGRTFHLVVYFPSKAGGHCDGFVKPWVGHTLHFVESAGLILLGAFSILVIAILIARSLADEWP